MLLKQIFWINNLDLFDSKKSFIGNIKILKVFSLNNISVLAIFKKGIFKITSNLISIIKKIFEKNLGLLILSFT